MTIQQILTKRQQQQPQQQQQQQQGADIHPFTCFFHRFFPRRSF